MLVTRSLARRGRRRPQAPHHLAVRVDLDPVDAGATPQRRLVLVLEPALAELVAELVPADLFAWSCGSRSGPRTRASARRSGRGGRCGSCRPRSTPRGTSTRARRCRGRRCSGAFSRMGTGLYRLYWSLARSASICAEDIPRSAASCPTTAGCCLGGHPRQGDVLGHLVAHDDVVGPVDDEAPRCGQLDGADLVGGHRLRVGRGVEDLQVPEPDEHEREQRRHHDAEHAQADDRCAAPTARSPA